MRTLLGVAALCLACSGAEEPPINDKQIDGPADAGAPLLPRCGFGTQHPDQDCPALFGYRTCNLDTERCTFACRADEARDYCEEQRGDCVGEDGGLEFCR